MLTIKSPYLTGFLDLGIKSNKNITDVNTSKIQCITNKNHLHYIKKISNKIIKYPKYSQENHDEIQTLKHNWCWNHIQNHTNHLKKKYKKTLHTGNLNTRGSTRPIIWLNDKCFKTAMVILNINTKHCICVTYCYPFVHFRLE